MEDLRTAAFLHDVGHLTMASGVSEIEVPGHAEEGERIVRGARFAEMVAKPVRHHHERWDGTGTPEALVMDQIPMASRVLAVVEAYEALTAGRGCERLAPPEALARVTERAGFEFDPAVVEGLKRRIQDGVTEPSLPSVALPAVAC